MNAMSHRIIHFEIPADDPPRLVEFYAQLLGWTIRDRSVPGFTYLACDTGDGPGINGAITQRLQPNQGPTNYVTVADIDDLLQKAESLGARIAVPKTPVAGLGWYALLLDPQGNPLGLWQKGCVGS